MAEYKFVKELPDDYQCMICTKVLNEPHLTDCCGQHFCQACLEQWFEKQEKKICPHCRSQSFNHMRYLPLKRKIDDIEVYCPNQAEGCKVITKLGEVNSHRIECGYGKVVCSQGCGKSILRKDLMQHCSKECPKRKIKCKFCGKEDCYETINGKHATVCEEYPVNCPRGCTLPNKIKRKDLAKHAEICSLEMVQCPFIEAGCDTRILRKDLIAHMESNTQQHLMKMMTAYSKLKIEHTKLHSEHSSLKEELERLSYRELTLAKLTDANNSFSFSLASSSGWSSPPFCILDGYKFCIRHKEGKRISLLLLQGENSDDLTWPMDLDYKLSFDFTSFNWKPRNRSKVSSSISSSKEKQSFFHCHLSQSRSSSNFRKFKRYEFSRELTEITLPWVVNNKNTVNQITVNLIRVKVPIQLSASSESASGPQPIVFNDQNEVDSVISGSSPVSISVPPLSYTYYQREDSPSVNTAPPLLEDNSPVDNAPPLSYTYYQREDGPPVTMYNAPPLTGDDPPIDSAPPLLHTIPHAASSDMMPPLHQPNYRMCTCGTVYYDHLYIPKFCVYCGRLIS